MVPSGQTLYITDITSNLSTGTGCSNYGIAINGVTLSASEAAGSQPSSGGAAGTASGSSNKLNYPMGIPSGYSVNSISCGTSLQGFTVPTTYIWVVFDLNIGNYTVPAGKILVIKNMVSNSGTSWNGNYSVAGNTSTYTKAVNFIDQGQTISASGLSGSLLMIGFLKNR
jgi:uncharacterized protein (DUF2147 family)